MIGGSLRLPPISDNKAIAPGGSQLEEDAGYVPHTKCLLRAHVHITLPFIQVPTPTSSGQSLHNQLSFISCSKINPWDKSPENDCVSDAKRLVPQDSPNEGAGCTCIFQL